MFACLNTHRRMPMKCVRTATVSRRCTTLAAPLTTRLIRRSCFDANSNQMQMSGCGGSEMNLAVRIATAGMCLGSLSADELGHPADVLVNRPNLRNWNGR